MDKLESAIHRGQEAERVLREPLIQEAKEHIEAELWRVFKEVNPQDKDTLAHIKAMQYYHQKYWAFLGRVVSDGKVAQINLEAKKKSLRERVFG